jgi:tRNA(fMet)-specific endonuclease VapC
MFLLDTCTLSDYLKGDFNTVQRLKQEQPNNISISSITVFEIDYGLKLKPILQKIINPQLQAIYSKTKIIEFSYEAAYQASLIRKNLKQAGTPIGAYDLLIGAIAVSNNLTLVTSNIQEFKRIEHLNLENWRV